MDQKQVLRNGITYENNSMDLAFDGFLDYEPLTSRLTEKIQERMTLMKDCGVFRDETQYHATAQVRTIQVNWRKLIAMIGLSDYVEILSEVWKEQPLVVETARRVLEKHGQSGKLDMVGTAICAAANNPLCYPFVDEIYQEQAEVYEKKREAAGQYDARFFAYFGVEEERYARRMAGILEYIRTEEGELSNRVYGQVSQMFMKGWPDIYRSLKKKTEVSYAYVYQLIRGMDGFRGPEGELSVARLCMAHLMVELLEIKKGGSFWFLMDYEVLFQVEQRFWEREKEQPDMKTYRKLRKQMEKKVPEIRKLVPVAAICVQYEEEAVERLRRMFQIGGLEMEALSQTELTAEEVEKILCCGGIGGEEELAAYMYQMSVVALCKYISHCKGILEKMIEEEVDRRKQKEDRKDSRKEGPKEKESNGKKRLEEVQRHLVYYKEETTRLNSVLKESQRQYEHGQKKHVSEQEQWERERQELIALRNFVYQLQQEDGERESEDDKEEKILESLRDVSVLVFGGHYSWQNKMKQKFPRWRFIQAEQQTFDLKAMDSYQYLVINTNMLKHRIYYKIMAEKDQYQKIVYVNGSNINRCIRQMSGQIC